MKLFKVLFISGRTFQVIGIIISLFLLFHLLDYSFILPKFLFLGLLAALITDGLLLFRFKTPITATRIMAEKLSNGDDNLIEIELTNYFPYTASIRIIDEIPHQFQRRNLDFLATVKKGEQRMIRYYLRPTKRGEYDFGGINVLVNTPLSLLTRRIRIQADKNVPVYPSYIQMRRYELLAISDRLVNTGIKKIRRVGHNMEFEQIKEYIPGEDIRSINWKATARRSQLMVNHYQDERSQQVYSLIDKGRVMQMPFDGLSLLDYAINASLVISNIAIRKSDKAGLITFQDKINATLLAGKQGSQMARIQEVLYNQKTAYRETDYSTLYTHIRRKVSQRSLLLLFTNFESIYGLQRQIPYLRALAKQHLLVVIFFENTEVKALLETESADLRIIYQKALAEKYQYDKKLMVKELASHGIQALLTPPEKLTINTINKYLELKARGLI